MKTRLGAIGMAAMLGGGLLAGAAASASGAGAPPPAERPAGPHAVPGWYLGLPVLLRAVEPPAGTDRKALPQFPVYVHAPVSATAGSAPSKVVPRPGGDVVLPPHQDTLACANSAGTPRLGVGYFVIRGPRGTEETVRTQPQPANSWPRSGLVEAIRIGAEWVPVNSHAVVEYGVRAGLLELQFFDVGGLMWAEPFDPAAREGFASAGCRVDPGVSLPEIDWLNDRDYVPGQGEVPPET